jgi:hypothetical protein
LVEVGKFIIDTFTTKKSRGTLDAVAEAILIVLLLNYIHHIALIRNEERRNTFFVKFHVPGDWNN